MRAQRNRPGSSLQLPLFDVPSEWRPPDMGSLPSWKGARRVAVDCETKDPYLRQLGIGVRRGGQLVGVSFAIEDGPKHYLPIRHKGGDNLPEEAVLRYMKDQGKSFEGEIVGANLSYDLDYLWEEKIEFPMVEFYRDIQVADPLIYELHESYSLDNIAKRYGLPGKNEAKLKEAATAFGVGPKDGLWKLPARYVGQYAEDDAEQSLLALRRQERKIDEDDLWNIFDLESRVLPVLVKMRRRGVRVNVEKLEKVEKWSLEQEAEALALIRDKTGVKISVGDVWKAEAVAPALRAIGVNLGSTSTGKPSIDKFLLGSIDHPVAKAVRRAREVNKLRTTFAASVRTYMTNGRIHTTFNQIAHHGESDEEAGVRYGRLSSTHPNLQQQPARSEFAPMWRSIYEAEEDAEWASCDYSQQEPRWTTHYAALIRLPGAVEAAQAYHDNPALDNHDFMTRLVHGEAAVEAMSKEEWKNNRTRCKQIYLGLCYGEGGAKLCRELGLPTRWALSVGEYPDRRVSYHETRSEAEAARAQVSGSSFLWEAAGVEGQEILDRFDARAPFIRKLARRASDRAKEVGFIVTAGGRRLHFEARPDGSYDFTHKTLNRIIQGSSADQMKKAMVDLDRNGHFLQLQIHDEMGSSVRDRAEAESIAEVMKNAMPALVPFKVDVEIGRSWGEAK